MKSKKHNAFTLIELMVTLALVGILATIALPGMSNFIKNERLTTSINSLLSYLQYARSEAILRHSQITVCASNDQATCSGNWVDGWIVTVTNADDSVTILKIRQALRGNVTLSSSGGTEVIFDRRGFSPASESIFAVCDDRGISNLKSISISKTGRVRNGGGSAC